MRRSARQNGQWIVLVLVIGFSSSQAPDDVARTGACEQDIIQHCSSINLRMKRQLLLSASDLEQTAKVDAMNTVMNQFNVTVSEDLPMDPNLMAPYAKCLLKKIREQGDQKKGAVESPISEECQEEVRRFFSIRYSSIEYDYGLLAGCSVDILARCKDSNGEHILGCLKVHKNQLLESCQEIITKRQIDAAEDLRFDSEIMEACSDDFKNNCKDTEYGQGEAMNCLYQLATEQLQINTANLKAVCMSAMFKRMMLDAEDIRFNHRLYTACKYEKSRYCDNVENGQGYALACLEQNQYGDDFGGECKAELKNVAMERANDFRLDYGLRTQCQTEVGQRCPRFQTFFLDPFKYTEDNNQVIATMECLRSNYTSISDPVCKQRVYQNMIDQYADPTLDLQFMRECKPLLTKDKCLNAEDKLICAHDLIKQGVNVARNCFDVVIERHVQRMQDINFNYNVVMACKGERQKFCATITPGEGKVIQCLQDHKSSWGFGHSCAQKVDQLILTSSYDIRLMVGVKLACDDDIQQLCGNISPGEGKVVHCLIDNRENLVTAACKVHLLKILGLMADDYRFDFQLYRGCQQDVKLYCNKVQPGNGRVHNCLRKHMHMLTNDCALLERAMESLESKELQLNTKVQEQCEEAIDIYCKDKKGEINVINCLGENMDGQHFPNQCSQAMKEQLKKLPSSIELDPKVKESCLKDVTQFCPESITWNFQGSKPKEDSATCLMRNLDRVQRNCHQGMVTTIRYQIQHYRAGVSLTKDCDPDVERFCGMEAKYLALLGRGQILKCLTSHAPELSSRCYSLVGLSEEWEIQFGGLIEKYWNTRVPFSTQRNVALEMEKTLDKQQKQVIERRLQKQVEAIPNSLVFGIVMLYITIICLVGLLIGLPTIRGLTQNVNVKKWVEKFVGRRRQSLFGQDSKTR